MTCFNHCRFPCRHSCQVVRIFNVLIHSSTSLQGYFSTPKSKVQSVHQYSNQGFLLAACLSGVREQSASLWTSRGRCVWAEKDWKRVALSWRLVPLETKTEWKLLSQERSCPRHPLCGCTLLFQIKMFCLLRKENILSPLRSLIFVSFTVYEGNWETVNWNTKWVTVFSNFLAAF